MASILTVPVTTSEVAPELITDDLVMELLNPTEPAMMRMVTSFQLSMVLRHAITLAAQGELADATWQDDLRASAHALLEVLG